MAQDISLARAVFVSALLRSDPPTPEVRREDATLFTKQLLKTLNECTSSNVKLCKHFILQNITQSPARTAALAKYLITLGKAFAPRESDSRVDTTKTGDENEGLGRIVNGQIQQPPLPAFKRLHILYVVHDVLCYVFTHADGENREAVANAGAIDDHLKRSVPALVQLAACGDRDNNAKTAPYITKLVRQWKSLGVFPIDEIESLNQKALAADEADWKVLLAQLSAEESNAREKLSAGKAADWILPLRHGVRNDPSAPWNELPAANGLYMKRTRGYPLRSRAMPSGGYELRNGNREASADLKKDVQSLYDEVLHCFDPYTNPDEVQDVDALGNTIWKDPERPTRNYWGFTVDGMEKRRRLAKRFADDAVGYDDPRRGLPGSDAVETAVERSRSLAAAHQGGMRGAGRGQPRGTRY